MTTSARTLSTLGIGLLLLGSMVQAATSTVWQVAGFSDFTKGHLAGLALDADGVLMRGPAVTFLDSLGEPAAWALAADESGGAYVATGHSGKVLHVDKRGTVANFWTASQPEVFALCVQRDGAVVAGTSPHGGIYRIRNGKSELIWQSTAKYIWAVDQSPDGSLYVATGEPGNIYRIDDRGQTQTYYETEQGNVTALAINSAGHVLAGTDPNGLLFEITGQGKARVLLDSSLPEIRSIVTGPNGTVYVAAMGGAVASRTAPATAPAASVATGPVTTTTPTVITVTESADSTAASLPAAAQGASSTSAASTPAAQTATSAMEVSGLEKSAIYRIGADRTVETLRTSKEDNVYDLALSADGKLLFATDVHGRIYSMDGHAVTLVGDLGDGVATRLLASGRIYVTMSNPARLCVLSPAEEGTGVFESQVHDATSVARWGHLQSHGVGAGIRFETRTGFSARPDRTWSEWSPVAADSQRILSPPARFIQFRASWGRDTSATLNSVAVSYLPANGPPVIHSIAVSSVLEQNPAKAGSSASASANAPYSITVTDTGEPPAASTASSANQTASHLQTTQTQISWQADDPDGDKLAYAVYFRAEDEREWQLVRSRMFENTLLLDPDVFADGRYFFRVVATDAPSNAPEFAQQTELVSTPVLIDNTPPEVHVGTPVRSANSVDVEVRAEDQTSPLRLCEYSLDAGSWQPIEAEDGVTDSQRETFRLHLDKIRPGEHLLVFRVYDAVNNAGLGKVVLR